VCPEDTRRAPPRRRGSRGRSIAGDSEDRGSHTAVASCGLERLLVAEYLRGTFRPSVARASAFV